MVAPVARPSNRCGLALRSLATIRATNAEAASLVGCIITSTTAVVDMNPAGKSFRKRMSAAQNTRVVMVRRDLERIPDFSLPPEFSLRFFEPGDEEHWRRIHVMADLHNPITPELFRNQFGTDDKLLADRQLYLLAPDKEPIGTATAWFDD